MLNIYFFSYNLKYKIIKFDFYNIFYLKIISKI
jgi:hypothetical protein